MRDFLWEHEAIALVLSAVVMLALALIAFAFLGDSSLGPHEFIGWLVD